jgi:outer membrane immunogenic protein
MNRNLFSVAAVFGSAMFAVPAVADEAPAAAKPIRQRAVERAPVREAAPERTAAAQPSWTGGQVGGQGGVSSMAQGFAEPGARLFPDCSIFPSSYCVETPFSFNGNKTSWTAGTFLGYRVQFGSVVAGIEGDVNGKSGTAAYTAGGANQFRAETFMGSAGQGWDSSIRGRLGWLVTPSTMIYGTGGVAFGKVTGSFGYSANEIDGCISCAYVNGGGTWSTVRTGATAGGGIETMFSTAVGPFPSMTLRLEYRYTDLGNFSENVPLHTFCNGTCTSPSSNALINLHPTFQTVTVGFGLNF